MGFSFWYGIPDIGLEKGGLAKQGKKVSGGHFFSPWKSPVAVGTQSARTVDTPPPCPPGRISCQAANRLQWVRSQGRVLDRPPKESPSERMGFSFWYGIPDIGLEKGGLAKQGKKVSGGHFFSPWKSPVAVEMQSAGL